MSGGAKRENLTLMSYRPHRPSGLVLGFASVLMCSAAAFGQKPPPPPAMSDVQVLVADFTRRQMPEGFMPHMRKEVTLQVIRQQRVELAAANRIFDEIVAPDLTAGLPDLEATLATSWTTRFSAQELHALREGLVDGSRARKKAFADTPLAIRFMGKEPVIASERNQAIQEWTTRHLRAVFDLNEVRINDIRSAPKTPAK